MDDAATNRRFAESLGADFPILADPGTAVARAYGVLGPFGMARRWTFYVGPDGTILYIDKEVRTSSAGPDMARRLAALGIGRK